MDDREREPPAGGSCWICDLLLALVWAPIAFVLNVGEPRSLKRGDRLLFFTFWGLTAAMIGSLVLAWW